jgi:hemolysin activation/secretion protein
VLQHKTAGIARGSGVKPRLFAAAALVSIIVGASASQALAQQSAALPTRDELAPVAPPQAETKAKVKIDGDLERAPCALDDPAYGEIKIKLTSATFNNLGPVPASALTDSYQRFVGTEQPIKIVCEIRDAAATTLRGLGYVAAVQVPVQQIVDGAVRFEVLFAKVTSVRVVGKVGRNEKLIESYLQKLADGQLFNRYAAERTVLLARDIPGYDVRLSLKPAGTGAGNMIAEVTLKQTPASVDFSAQNYAAASTGRIGGQLRATFNGLTGMGDRTSVSVYSTGDFKEQQIFQLSHDLLLGNNGLRIGGRLTLANTKPTLGPLVPDVNAHTLFANAEASYPLIRKQALTVRGALGLDVVNQKVRFAGVPLSEDRVRVAYLKFDFDALDLKGKGPGNSVAWRANGSIELRKGLGLFGASPNCLRVPLICGGAGFTPPSLPDGNPKATLLRVSANLELQPIRGAIIALSPRVQIGSSPVFAFEQFSTGNYSIGRGFDPGAATGDRGAGFQAEMRLNSFRLSPRSKLDVQPYAFSDNAWLWNEGSLIGNPQRLHSAGGGVRIGWAGQARLDLMGAVPLSRLPTEAKRRSPRFLLSYTMNILPWRAN